MALTYNQPRFAQNLLSKYKKCVPSFSISLYDDHWILNKGPSKFLYTQPVSGLLDEVRALRIPVDFIEIFDMANVPYYDGCMIVESIDYRKPRAHHQQASAKEPESVRVVLQPTPESLYVDLCLLNAKYGNKWTDQEALEVESKILNATCPPLCLDPDVNLTRVVNSVIRASTPAEIVLSKRKQAHEPEEDENDKAKRAKLWSQYMHPHNGKQTSLVQGKRSIFDILHEVAYKDDKGTYIPKLKPPKAEPVPYLPQGQPQNGQTSAPPNPPHPLPRPTSTPSAQPAQDDQKAKAKLKVVKKPDLQESQLQLAKGKKKLNTSAPAQGTSPVSEQKKPGPVAPGMSRTPVDANAAVSNSSNAPPQYPQPPQPPKSVLKKQEEQGAQKHPHSSQQQLPQTQQQPNPIEQPHPPAAWQPQVPSTQYLSQPPPAKKKPVPQPQQASPYNSHSPTPGVPGFANNNGFPQNPAYKNAAGIPQNPNMNPNRASPMVHNQPLLSRSPLPPHTQSPHPQAQQPQQVPQPVPQHQHPQHAAHQFNMHMQQQNRYNPGMQGQMGHHPHAVPPQHGVPQQQHQPPPPQQQHHPQHHPTAPRAAGQPSQHDQSQAMLQLQQHYSAMQQQQFTYPQMHMMNGMRMPGAQGAGGQFLPTQAWRVPVAGRGGGPMTTIPMGMPHGQAFQHPQMMAALARGQPPQQQPQGQGR